MAVQTEPKYISDVVKHEEPSRYSRDEATLAASQTLAIGTVCRTTAAKRKVAITAPVNEVQTIGITGTLTGGTWSMTFRDSAGDDKTTDLIAENANTAAIQTGVDTALGANKVTVAGTAITAMTFTFDGEDYAGLDQEMIQVDSSAVVGVEDVTVAQTTRGGAGGEAAINEIQTVTVTGTPTAGDWTLTAKDESGIAVTTAALAWNASTGTVQTELDTKFGTNAIVAGGTAVTAATYTFSGTNFEGRDHDPVVMDISSLTGATAVATVETTRGGPGGSSNADSICLVAKTTGAGEVSTTTTFLARSAIVRKDQLVIGTAVMQDVVDQLGLVGILVRE